MSLNESIGQAGRSSHFEFGTPDPNATDFKRNEIPIHARGGMKDHNQSTQDYYKESLADSRKPRPEQNSHFDLGGGSPSPAAQQGSHRGPPTASFDVYADQAPEHNVHGREYNMSRRPPPQSQYDFVSGASEDNYVKPASRASSQRFAQTADEDRSEQGNIHGREYNMSRRPPPQAQYDFMGDSSAPEQQDTSRASVRRFTPTSEPDNVHGREYNMSRRPPPQAQYDLMADDGPQEPQSFGRASQRRFTPTEQPDNVHGREYNMSRRAPPQAQYDFMGDSSAQGDDDDQMFPKSSQRKYNPDQKSDSDNIHGREYNMGVCL